MTVSDDRLKLIFGFVLLVIVAGLAAAIALGHVIEATSYGLDKILLILSGLGGAFGVWAFGGTSGSGEK